MDLDDELRHLLEARMREDHKTFRIEMDGDRPTFVIRITSEDLTTFLTVFCVGLLYVYAIRGIRS